LKTNAGEEDTTTETLSGHPAPGEVASGWAGVYGGKVKARGAPAAPTAASRYPSYK